MFRNTSLKKTILPFILEYQEELSDLDETLLDLLW